MNIDREKFRLLLGKMFLVPVAEILEALDKSEIVEAIKIDTDNTIVMEVPNGKR